MAALVTGLPLPSPGGLGDYGPPGVPALDPGEMRRRLEETRWELENRRKILVRNLPADCCSQDIQDLLKDYEIKYCYVDKNKKTAFITLSNGEQAQDAINRFHRHHLRDKEILVQLQPTDALLCVTNLPPLFSKHEFEELVRAYGNIERCLLVYSELTGLSKGYGFVEYMKKDCASKARLELLGKQLEEFTLFAQWVDVNQLTADFIHSKCLCVDKLPKDYSNSDELTQIFSSLHEPLFCQLAEDEDGYSGGFAVVEYESARQAEEMKDCMDGMHVRGGRIQVSYCSPGSPGRSMLATLMAAQGMLQNNRKGLLPEPNPMQIMQSLNNPAMLQMLFQPPHRGRSGKHGSSGRPHFNATVNQALLQLHKLNPKPSLAGNHLLQNYSHLQAAHQQLLQLKGGQSNNSKPGLLGEAPGSILQSAMGTAQTGSVEAPQKNLLPYLHNQQLSASLSRLAQDNQSALTLSDGSLLGGQSYAGTLDTSNLNKMSNQTSLLGEPPRDYRLSTNPYLNLASVLPGMPPRGVQAHAMDGLLSQDSTGQPGLENYFSYSQQYGDYSQEAIQQWYDQYSGYSSTQADVPGDSSQQSSTLGYGEYSAYVQAPPTYYTNAQASYQVGSALSVDKTISTEKRPYILSSPEVGTIGYTQQYTPTSGDSYADSYIKRKKVY
ncbi:ribonucleoprotein PTB-binding 2 isoform X2 [Rana temporaria]|uniref:ribonucleoprotein PTB-binding 2 isoform X2 n=1 Tax=Rana temporaria TaxID=8407 RepID=UPI001AAD0CF0|nr:ribonucleoprotein PTB-binding 2 isoform X2 [Rana temporaria]